MPDIDPGIEYRQKRRRGPVFISLVAVLVIVLGTGGTFIYQAWNEARLERLAQESLSEAFGAETLRLAVSNCGAIRNAVEDVAEEAIQAQADALTAVTTPRDAYAAANDPLFPSVNNSPGYQRSVTSLVEVGFQGLLANERRAEIAPPEQRNRWSAEWFNFALQTCGVRSQYLENVAILNSSDEEFERVRQLAVDAPWYPEGFEEWDSNWAYQVVPNASAPCRGCRFVVVDVVSKKTCSSLVYGEIDFFNGSRFVDWSNDTLDYLAAGALGRLTFYSYARTANLWEFSELNCY